MFFENFDNVAMVEKEWVQLAVEEVDGALLVLLMLDRRDLNKWWL